MKRSKNKRKRCQESDILLIYPTKKLCDLFGVKYIEPDWDAEPVPYDPNLKLEDVLKMRKAKP